jgi:hypothetical protein
VSAPGIVTGTIDFAHRSVRGTVRQKHAEAGPFDKGSLTIEGRAAWWLLRSVRMNRPLRLPPKLW